MGDGRWEMGDGRWEMGDGRWEMGMGECELVSCGDLPTPSLRATPVLSFFYSGGPPE